MFRSEASLQASEYRHLRDLNATDPKSFLTACEHAVKCGERPTCLEDQ